MIESMDSDAGGAGVVDEGVIVITDGGGGRRLGGAVGSVPDGNGAAVLEAGNPMRRVRRLPVPGLCLGCKRKGAGRSRLYQSYQEPGVELGEEVGLPFLSSVSKGLPGSNFLSSVSKPGQPWLFRTGVSLF